MQGIAAEAEPANSWHREAALSNRSRYGAVLNLVEPACYMPECLRHDLSPSCLVLTQLAQTCICNIWMPFASTVDSNNDLWCVGVATPKLLLLVHTSKAAFASLIRGWRRIGAPILCDSPHVHDVFSCRFTGTRFFYFFVNNA